ncbi:TetR/AcrR family transcriptional regulator [Kordiimonas gwangyangensis]|uniref:TetR/AcrR family transcriptional regulator n=1 Tax=Kordiimonas gwangyangensis TaxID=288022 RepID=UPI000689010B|nr:TetR/AcrR family transcriptional regulator [Kordiimonas gwangyangensis]
MPRIAKYSRTAMAERFVSVFKTYGYEGASLSLLADSVELSKASLYHHFPGGKEQIAAQALAHSGARLQRLVLAPLASAKAGQERLQLSLRGVTEYYDGDVPVCLMNSLLLGEGRTLFGSQIKAAVDAWTKGLARATTEAGLSNPEAWARQSLEQIQGALVICRVVGNRSPLHACLEKLSHI